MRWLRPAAFDYGKKLDANVLQLTDSFCFSQKFWLGAVSG